MAKHVPSNSDDVVDSRDIIERYEELRDKRADLTTDEERAAWDEENGEEYAAILELNDEGSNY